MQQGICDSGDVSSIGGKIREKEISPQSLKLIETMSKHVVLVIISLLTTIISFTFLTIRTIQFLKGKQLQNDINSYELFIQLDLIVFDTATNLFCVMLQFAICNNIYKKWCKLPHQCCQRFVKHYTVNSMIEMQLSTTSTKEIPQTKPKSTGL